MLVFLYILIGMNLFTFLLFWIDKYKAIHQHYRISENALMISAALFGSVGALAGMWICHHKTKKPKFYIGVPALLVLQVLFIVYIALNTWMH